MKSPVCHPYSLHYKFSDPVLIFYYHSFNILSSRVVVLLTITPHHHVCQMLNAARCSLSKFTTVAKLIMHNYFHVPYWILTFHLWCCSGNPVPEITWLKDGQPVSGEERLLVMSHGRFLHINNALVIDTGRYSCLASNSAGDRSAHFNLNILGECVFVSI